MPALPDLTRAFQGSPSMAPRCREWVGANDFVLRDARGARN